MKMHQIIVVIMLLTLIFGISSAEIYKWVDENGVTHYSDSPTHDIPGPTETVHDDMQSSKAVSGESRTAPEEAHPGVLDSNFSDFIEDSQKEDVAMNAPVVEIYETDWCAYCKMAKNFFRSRGIKFIVYDIDKDQQAARRMMTMTDIRAVPFVVINGKGIQGYSEQAYTLALQN